MIDTSLDSSNFYFLLAVFQGLILAVLILNLRPRRRPNIYFGILILLFSSALLHLVLESSIHAFNVNFPVPMEFGMAYGPLAYLHILHIKDPMRKASYRDLLHFLPTILFDFFLFTATFLYLKNHMEWAYENIPFIQGTALFISLLGITQLALYTYFIYRESINTKPVLKEFDLMRKWLSILMIMWSIIIAFLMIAIPVGFVFIEDLDVNSEWLYLPLGVILSLWIFLLGYAYLLKYSKVIESYMNKIAKFKISNDEIDEKKTQIIAAIEQEGLYKDPKITVAKLAGHLGWPINSVSRMINETLQSNFNDLINQYRVAAFKNRASEPDRDKYSVLGLGQEVGFSSKASFYRIFKKETGMTPAEYLKTLA